VAFERPNSVALVPRGPTQLPWCLEAQLSCLGALRPNSVALVPWGRTQLPWCPEAELSCLGALRPNSVALVPWMFPCAPRQIFFQYFQVQFWTQFFMSLWHQNSSPDSLELSGDRYKRTRCCGTSWGTNRHKFTADYYYSEFRGTEFMRVFYRFHLAKVYVDNFLFLFSSLSSLTQTCVLGCRISQLTAGSEVWNRVVYS
jgi:hypothetical protein